MTLRVNQLFVTRDDYLKELNAIGIDAEPDALAPHAVVLAQPCDVHALPGFAVGWVSVQDSASQLVPTVLPLEARSRVLDACAAPGGKTCALLEAHPTLDMTALDAEPSRLVRVQDNLARLQLTATVDEGDITQAHPFLPASFDAVLLDVPCSGTGVIRRHPDIKLLRTPSEVAVLVKKQRNLLAAAWPLVREGGYLLYSTCSVLKAENDAQIAAFIADNPTAEALPPEIPGATRSAAGTQLFPSPHGHDGFYYALLRK